jgi:RNA polymerase sigma factor (sigma-70 family)
MARGQLESALRHLRTMLVTKDAELCADAELVRCFVESRDERAFTVLVKRYGALVLNVCRHILRTEADAEDAFQATFLVLARRAATIRKADTLACWFHRVAYRCANDLRRSAMRRRKREQRADDARVPESAAAQASLNELQALLDAEIERLPEKCRAPFILCCLEGKSRCEASQTLGWKEGTVSGRLAQARALLQKRLTSRGVTLSAALGAVALGPASMASVLSMPLAHRTIDGALAFAAGHAADPVSAQAVAIAQGVMKGMLVGKMKFALLATLVVSLTVFAASGLGGRVNIADVEGQQNVQPAAVNDKTSDDDGGVPVRVVFQGKPVAGVKVWAVHRDSLSDKLTGVADVRVTDEQGTVRVPWSAFANRPERSLSLFARAVDGRVGGTPFPPFSRTSSIISIELHATMELTGRVQGTDGQPLAGIDVSAAVFTPRSNDPTRNRSSDNAIPVPSWDADTQAKRSDAEGKFTLSRVPAGMSANVRLQGPGYGDSHVTVATDKSALITLAKAGSVRVLFRGSAVGDTKGLAWSLNQVSTKEKIKPPYNPVAQARKSGAFDGASPFVIDNVPPGQYSFRVDGQGNSPVDVKTEDKSFAVKSGETADVVFELTKLAKTSGRIVDAETGRPAANVRVDIYRRDPANYHVIVTAAPAIGLSFASERGSVVSR